MDERLEAAIQAYGGDMDSLLLELQKRKADEKVKLALEQPVEASPFELMHQRFGRNFVLLGEQHGMRLRTASIVIIGVGGVGSWTAEAVARAGFGRITLIDWCDVKRQNVSRQICALESTVGQFKVDVLRSRLLDINPDCAVVAIPREMTVENAGELLDSVGGVDVVVDAFDEMPVKAALASACRERNITCLVSSLGAATRLDPGMVRVADISKTSHCPLARNFRRALATRGITSGVCCLYSLEPPRNKSMTSRPHLIEKGEARLQNPEAHWIPHCMGSWVALPAIFGVIAAQIAVCSLAPDGTAARELYLKQMGLPTAHAEQPPQRLGKKRREQLRRRLGPQETASMEQMASE